MEQKRDFTEGKLYVISTKVYQLIMVFICLLMACSPSLFLLLFLERSIRYIWLFAVSVFPLGPGVAAGFSTMLLILEGEINSPFRDYWKKYFINFKDSSKLWILYIFSMMVCLIDINYLNGTEFNSLSWLLLLIMIVLSNIIIFALIISVKFSFRTKDILKLSMYYNVTQFPIALKILSYLTIMLGIMAVISDVLIFFGGIYLMWVCLKAIQPVFKDVEQNFVDNSN